MNTPIPEPTRSRRKRQRLSLFGAAAALALLAGAACAQDTVLPKPDKPFAGKIARTREDSVQAWPEQPKAPKGAPNVILILLDDVGFGASSTFGGPAATPNLQALASHGVRYNDFNTTAISSPTRAALLTGRNHHQVGFGNLTDVSTGFPAYDGVWSPNTASVAEILKDNGYSTAAIGKWHNTPNWEITPAGPFNHWPTGLGFEYFYGFMFGESSEWEPQLYRNTSPVDAPAKPKDGYHLTTDLVNESIKWIHQHEAVASDKPFFLYLATGATHAPVHVPQDWIDKYKGKFDQGWDKLREETFARQKAAGIIPANAELTPRPKELPAWDSLTPDQKKLYAHQMEVYAAYLSQTDAEIGRLLKSVNDDGLADNTLIIYVVGDNGASAEGGLAGSDSNFGLMLGANNDQNEQLAHYSDLGSPLYDNHYASGWSWATTTPFQWMKQVASHFGGTRNGLVVSWANHTAHPEIVRCQFGHVNDIAPTIYEAAGITFPDTVNGARQLPLEGKSLVQTFTDPKAPETHTEQYFEIFGNRAIYKDGWVAGTRRYAPWELFTNPAKVFGGDFENDKWELYHVSEDYSEAHDLADKDPAKLAELKAEFDKEAVRNGVYPLVPLPQGAPTTVPKGKTHYTYLSGVERLTQANVPVLGGRSHTITAELTVPKGGADGVILADGGRYGGFSIYVKDGHVVYEENALGQLHEKVVSSDTLPEGQVSVRTVFTAAPAEAPKSFLARLTGGAPAPGTAEIYIGDRKVGEGRFQAFGGFASSITETFDLGKDTGSAVSHDYDGPNPFKGTVDKVNIDLN
ncbi:arylsulfatase [Asticcacaulis solisilvae]|uniref:arylsulfatase n=1 Tax=Asticcacaulis solisilvae TaxID=1217274 RepID=UPI003FD7BBD2